MLVLGSFRNWTLHQTQGVKSWPDEESHGSLTHASGRNPESPWNGTFVGWELGLES